MICEQVNTSGARAMAIPETVGTPIGRSAKHGHKMDVSVSLSETPPVEIVQYEEPEEKKAERKKQLQNRLTDLIHLRAISFKNVEKAKKLKTKWAAIAEDAHHDMMNLQESLQQKRKKLSHAESQVKTKDIAVAHCERTLKDLDDGINDLSEEWNSWFDALPVFDISPVAPPGSK